MKTKSTTQENSRPAPGRQILYIDGAGMGPDGTGSGYAVLNQTTGERWVGRKDSLTNNQAEYLALGLAVKRLPHGSAAEIRSDSEVVVKQFSGEYRVKVPQLKKLLRQIRDVIEERELDVTLRWIPREENLADALLRRQVAEARRELRNKRLYSEFFLSFGPPTWLVTITLEGDYTPGEDRFVAEVKEFLGQLKDDADDEFGWVLATDRGRLGKRLHGHLLQSLGDRVTTDQCSDRNGNHCRDKKSESSHLRTPIIILGISDDSHCARLCHSSVKRLDVRPPIAIRAFT